MSYKQIFAGIHWTRTDVVFHFMSALTPASQLSSSSLAAFKQYLYSTTTVPPTSLLYTSYTETQLFCYRRSDGHPPLLLSGR